MHIYQPVWVLWRNDLLKGLHGIQVFPLIYCMIIQIRKYFISFWHVAAYTTVVSDILATFITAIIAAI